VRACCRYVWLHAAGMRAFVSPFFAALARSCALPCAEDNSLQIHTCIFLLHARICAVVKCTDTCTCGIQYVNENVYVCVRVRLRSCVFMRACMRVCVCVHLCVRAGGRACVRACVLACVRARWRACVRVCVCACSKLADGEACFNSLKHAP